MIELKPCPFCGGKAYFSIHDDEGNERDADYENNPWSGLSYKIRHGIDDNEGCPIANFDEDDGTLGCYLYSSRERAAEVWNKRA